MSYGEMMAMVVGMAIVTYLPRLLPLLLFQKVSLPPKVHQFLSFIPFAMLGALIIPGVFSSTGHLYTALLGFIAAVILSLFRLPVIIPIIGSIIAVYIGQLFF